jgi:hypothetical protein
LASRQQLPLAFQQLLVPHVYAALAPGSSRNAQPRPPKKTAWRTIMVRCKKTGGVAAASKRPFLLSGSLYRTVHPVLENHVFLDDCSSSCFEPAMQNCEPLPVLHHQKKSS